MLIWANLISSLGNRKPPLQHLARILIQLFPALALQAVYKNNIENHEAVNKRLELWRTGN